MLAGSVFAQTDSAENDRWVEDLLSRMTLDEKIGQMTQVDMHALKDNS